MKFRNLLAIAIFLVIAISSCKSDTETIVGNWVAKSQFSGDKRANGASFAINNIGYYGLGNDEDNYKNDFWKYNPETNVWSQVKTFSGTARAFCISTASETKGFVGMGYDGNNDLKDFWEYNPITDEWTKLEDFIGGERRYAVAFAIGDFVYAGTGSSANNKTYNKDFYKYSISSGKWSSENAFAFSGNKRTKSSTFVLNGKGYVIGGYDNGLALVDFCCFDPATNSWSKKNTINISDTGGDTNLPRFDACAFVSNGVAYFACGRNSSGTPSTNVYQWNSSNDSWTIKTDFEGNSRSGAGVFVLNNKGYIVGGTNGSNSYLDNMFMFMPDEAKNNNDNN